MTTNWDSCRVIEHSPDVMGGVPVFVETRVPVAALFENLKDGATVSDFLHWFPGVTKQQVDDVLGFVAKNLNPSCGGSFDQGTPAPLRNFLQPHVIETAFERR